MCGIAGILERSGRRVERELLVGMTRVLAHRGPDGEGIYVDGSAGLGHRRLSIIDLDAGAQPLANEDASVWVAFNGEIYNYRELAAELRGLGHVFRTASDTEVLVHGYEQWGVGLLERLNGMFAFALWDAPRRQMLLARDRLGIKPLVFRLTTDRLVFGSEIKALLRHPSVPRQVNPQAVADVMSFRVVAAPATAFQGVERLSPGEALLVPLEGTPKKWLYWDAPVETPRPFEPKALAHYAEELDALIEDSVRLEVRSDVPLGAFLSGGVDSSAVVKHMAKHLNSPPRTFTIGYSAAQDSAYNESNFARDVAERLGAAHTEYFLPHYEIAPLVERLLWFFDEPCGTAIPNYFVSQIARRQVTVALSGIGGDELFAGYGRYRLPPDYDDRRDRRSYLERFVTSQMLTPPEDLPSMLAPGVSDALAQPDQRARWIDDLPAGLTPLNAAARIDLKNYLANDLLPYMDNMSMAHSLEVRVPLLDHRIVEFAARLPDEAKLYRGISKYLLRRTLVGQVPDHVLTRSKKGFQLPLRIWLASLRQMVETTLTRDRVADAGLLRWPAVERLLRAYYERGDTSWRTTYQIWTAMMLHLWHARFIVEAPALEAPSLREVQVA